MKVSGMANCSVKLLRSFRNRGDESAWGVVGDLVFKAGEKALTDKAAAKKDTHRSIMVILGLILDPE